MKVEGDERCMHAEFGGRGFSGFRNFTAFKFGKKFFSDYMLLCFLFKF